MTPQLTPDECRVLGTLIEKAQTTPAQYPLTLNGLLSGVNQKSNREPVVSIREEQALVAIDALRSKGFVREVTLSGSRVEKFRHVARETLEVSTAELVVLAELLLRGPQTVGELRARASRMHPLESIEVTGNVLEHLRDREVPLVRELPPPPGSRAAHWVQLLCPDLHALPAAAPSSEPPRPVGTPTTPAPTTPTLEARHAALEARVARLEAALRELGADLPDD